MENKIRIKMAASLLGICALYGVWQAGSYNQDKQAQWSKKGQQVVIQELPLPQPSLENQTEIPVIPLERIAEAPAEQPVYVTQDYSVQEKNTDDDDAKKYDSDEEHQKHDNKDKNHNDEERN